MVDLISFEKDIKPLFTYDDIDHMQFFCDLSSKDDNQKHAREIVARLKGEGGRVMPPAAPWPQTQIDLYQKWIADGFQS
jgi:hypothetical protein